MKCYIRKTKKIENLKEQKSLRFLYTTSPGRMILKVITKPMFSKPAELIANSKISKIYIKRFIKNNNININDYEQKKYKSFNDFFTRKVNKSKRNTKSTKNQLISPCDSKLTVYKISNNLTIKVKNSKYTIKNLIKEQVPDNFKGGQCLVFRLCVDDYHRYHAFDNMKIIKTKTIKGKLHTVNPISYENYQVFTENQREVTKIRTENFNDIYQIEVGALNVGKIHNNNKKTLKKYEEKGYFSFGGSTIIILFQKDEVQISKDIIKYSAQNIETKIEYGDIIGQSLNIKSS